MEDNEKLLHKIEELEQRVQFLEETIEALSNISASETAKKFIVQRKNVLSMSQLLNSMTCNVKINEEEQVKVLNSIEKSKKELDNRIAELASTNIAHSETTNANKLFSYSVRDKEIQIESYNGFEADALVIPERIDGKIVVGIAESAFERLEVKQIWIPDTVTYISSCAFKFCKKLSYIKLSNRLYNIGDSVFLGCENLKSIDLPTSLSKIGKSCFVGTGLEKIVLPPHLGIIRNRCFFNCTHLKTIILSSGLKKIEAEAFSYSPIVKIVIPENVSEVSGEAFHEEIGYKRGGHNFQVAFLGMETRFNVSICSFNGVVYCLPGSQVQKYARLNGIQMRPLSEFQS